MAIALQNNYSNSTVIRVVPLQHPLNKLRGVCTVMANYTRKKGKQTITTLQEAYSCIFTLPCVMLLHREVIT